MRKTRLRGWLLCAFALFPAALSAQDRSSAPAAAELRLRIVSPAAGKHAPAAVPAVVWLEPIAGTPALSFQPHGRYTLLQKNRMFTPHLQVIPVGTVVQFPNADPFFHNVFSLFDGKRFDLGLYEAGSSKSVMFSHEGVSYIFCNIHPEMSAVVLALSTPLYAIADATDSFVIRDIPAGEFKMHLWIEGVPQPVLDGMDRSIHFSDRAVDLGSLTIPAVPAANPTHRNKFGGEYDPSSKSPYER
jgi:plastocyanin